MTKNAHGHHVSAFLSKTYDMINSGREQIRWSRCGTYFVIPNPHRLAENVLPLFFKHSNLATFIRQLNMYGFSKVTSEMPGDACYKHPLFIKDRPELMEQIKRKNNMSPANDGQGGGSGGRSSIGSGKKRKAEDISPIPGEGFDDSQSRGDLLSRLEFLEKTNESLLSGNTYLNDEVVALRQDRQMLLQVVNSLRDQVGAFMDTVSRSGGLANINMKLGGALQGQQQNSNNPQQAGQQQQQQQQNQQRQQQNQQQQNQQQQEEDPTESMLRKLDYVDRLITYNDDPSNTEYADDDTVPFLIPDDMFDDLGYRSNTQRQQPAHDQHGHQGRGGGGGGSSANDHDQSVPGV